MMQSFFIQPSHNEWLEKRKQNIIFVVGSSLLTNNSNVLAQITHSYQKIVFGLQRIQLSQDCFDGKVIKIYSGET